MRRGIGCFLVILVVLYLGIGPAFHARWQRTLQVCRRAQSIEGAFVEPEWSPLLTAAVDITFWPVYAWANGYHNGRVFATCPE